jgi:RNA polymerase sigma-70 factor, ECF subfamily
MGLFASKESRCKFHLIVKEWQVGALLGGSLRLLDAKNPVQSSYPRQLVLDDCALLERVQQDDEQSLVLLYDRYSKLVYSVALRVLGNPASAEDVLQDVFMQIWLRSQHPKVAEGTLSGWLVVVARNRSIDVLRRRRPADSLDGLILASSYNLANHAEHNLMCEKARGRIAELPGEQRKLLEMAFFEGLSHSEIAKKTGKPLGTVKSSIRNALSTLRKGFQADGAGRIGESSATGHEDGAGLQGELLV